MLFTLLVALAGCVHAQSRDPLHTPNCAAAREALAGAEARAAAARHGAHDELIVARKRAQFACLGRESGQARRVGASEPPIAVPPPVIEAREAQPAVMAPSPPLRPEPGLLLRPATITACDPGGCWDNEGRRLNQAGPLLLGPRGACIVQGGLVLCP